MGEWESGSTTTLNPRYADRRLLLTPSPSLPLSFIHLAAALIAVWLVLSGGLLAIRTLTHATQPFSIVQLFVTTAGLTIAAWASRAAWTLGSANRSRSWPHWLPAAMTTVGISLWAISFAASESKFAIALCWFILMGEEAWAWKRQFMAYRRPGRSRSVQGRSSNDRVVQQLTRLVTAEGEEVIRGTLMVIVERGSRLAVGHIAFCPPLAKRPQFEVRAVNAMAALKVSQLYPHGARVEVRFTQPVQAGTPVPVQFVARASNSPVASSDLSQSHR